MSKRPTPITDSAAMLACYCTAKDSVVSANLARELERELAEKTEEADDAIRDATNAVNDIIAVRLELKVIREQRDALLEASKLVVISAPRGGPLWIGSKEIQNLITAMNVTKGGEQ